MLKKRDLIFYLFIISLLIFGYTFFVPQFEKPDGVHFLVKFYQYSFGHKEIPNIFNKDFYKDIYYFILLPFFNLLEIFDFSVICQELYVINRDNTTFLDCTSFVSINKNVYSSYGKFGIDASIYTYLEKNNNYQHNYIVLLFSIFLICGIFIILFRSSDNVFLKTTILFFFTPSVLHNISYINPSSLSVFLNILFFYLFINKKYFIFFLFCLFSTFLDYQNIIHFFIFFLILSFKLFENKNENSFLFLVFFGLVLLIFINQFFGLSWVFYPVKFLTPNFSTNDLEFLTTDYSLFSVIKSFISLFLSIYFVGGSMQYLSSLFEYFLFFVLVIYYLYENFSKIFFYKISSLTQKNNFYYFIFIFFSFIFLFLIFNNLDQGRYFLIFLLPFYYYFLTQNNLKINFHQIILLLFSFNILTILRIGLAYI